LRDLWNKGKWKADIPAIQSALRKGEALEGDFFKKEPEWIDFEEGFVVERKEVDEIIEKLENDNIQLVLGEPASGKSVILKNIGFKLAKESKAVYVVELKKHSRDEVKRYFDDIPEIKDGKTVFIVDDAHLLPAECERLVRDFKNRKLKAKLIIGSRETRGVMGEYPKEASEFEYLSKTEIHAEDVTEEMIKTSLKREHHFSDERINTVSKNLEKYKKDLWFLAWALKAYDPERDSVKVEEIYEKVRELIRNISAGKDKPAINAEDVLLPLSVFYRFEIPIERNFLEEQLEIGENEINQLIELSEIIQTEEAKRNQMLSLIHSSIAESYFETYQAYPSLGRKTKKKILNQSDEDLQYCLFYKYMVRTDPRNSIDVAIHLKKGGIITLKKLIEDKEIEESIKEGIEKEENMAKIGWCVKSIACANEEVALKVIEAVSNRIEKEEDAVKIGWCMWYIASASKETGLKLANCINIDLLLPKIEKAEGIVTIGFCVRGIAAGSEEVAQESFNRLNPKLRKELKRRFKLPSYLGLSCWMR
jgi:KaiC/GvpD/RAD55 family RecA-like ATPase